MVDVFEDEQGRPYLSATRRAEEPCGTHKLPSAIAVGREEARTAEGEGEGREVAEDLTRAQGDVWRAPFKKALVFTGIYQILHGPL